MEQADTIKIPEIEDENSHFKSCSKCAHAKTCGAYEAFSSVLTEMEEKFDFVKKPFPSESLAVTCTEFLDVRVLATERIERIENIGDIGN